MAGEVILIKLGGSLITDKQRPLTAREKVIAQLMREIREAVKKLGRKKKIIIGHGSGSFGHYAVKQYGLKRPGAWAAIHQVAAQLNRIVINQGRKLDLPLISFPPSSWILSRNHQVKKSFVKPIRVALNHQLIPVVYGDLIIDLVRGGVIFSTEKVFSVLTRELTKSRYQVKKIIHAGITNGVYDQQNQTIPLITPQNFDQIKPCLTQARGFDITGGMDHKITTSLALAQKQGIVSLIINGQEKGELKRAILGQEIQGTKISLAQAS